MYFKLSDSIFSLVEVDCYYSIIDIIVLFFSTTKVKALKKRLDWERDECNKTIIK